MDIKKIRADLETVANYQRNMPQVRADAIQAARDAGLTWREIAQLLEMTEHGVMKAAKRSLGSRGRAAG